MSENLERHDPVLQAKIDKAVRDVVRRHESRGGFVLDQLRRMTIREWVLVIAIIGFVTGHMDTARTLLALALGG